MYKGGISQVIHNVNKKKNRANKYDFLCELCEQEHHISFVRFFFNQHIIMNCERTLIVALHNP